jgi:hypothetical protein
MGVIAEQLGHADTRMTEKHYAHLAPSYVADTIRAHFPILGIGGKRAACRPTIALLVFLRSSSHGIFCRDNKGYLLYSGFGEDRDQRWRLYSGFGEYEG